MADNNIFTAQELLEHLNVIKGHCEIMHRKYGKGQMCEQCPLRNSSNKDCGVLFSARMDDYYDQPRDWELLGQDKIPRLILNS